MRLVLLFLLCAVPLAAQRLRIPQVVDEYAGGLLGNAVLRGPWISPAFRKPLPRLMIFSALSGFYEGAIDGHHPGNTAQAWIDWGERMTGYLATEAFIALLKRKW